jgi:hypothetical protein
MYCKKCGEHIPDNSKFCPKCGMQISKMQLSGNSDKNPNTAKHSNKKYIIGVAAVCIAAFLIVFILISRLYRHNDPSSPETAADTVSDTTNSGSDDVSLEFLLYEPNPDVVIEDLPGFLMEYTENIPTAVYKGSYRGEEVTLDLVKTLPKDSVITWNGHGGSDPFTKSYLASGEYFNWDLWWTSDKYYGDCVHDRIIKNSTESQEDLACFTS